MAISVKWGTGLITINQSDTEVTFISGTTYELDTDAFRLALKALEDNEEGMPYPRITKHNTVVVIDGVNYVRSWEIINGYTIQCLPNSSWRLKMDGLSNNNFHSEGILILNDVQVIPSNSAGNTETGTSGLTVGEAAELVLIRKLFSNRQEVVLDTGVVYLRTYDDDGSTLIQENIMTDPNDAAPPLDGVTKRGVPSP